MKTRLLGHEVKLINENRDTSSKILHIENKVNEVKRQDLEVQKYCKNYRSKVKPKFDNTKVNVRCDHCGRKEHYKNECRFLEKKIKSKFNQEKLKSVQCFNCTSDRKKRFCIYDW